MRVCGDVPVVGMGSRQLHKTFPLQVKRPVGRRTGVSAEATKGGEDGGTL